MEDGHSGQATVAAQHRLMKATHYGQPAPHDNAREDDERDTRPPNETPHPGTGPRLPIGIDPIELLEPLADAAPKASRPGCRMHLPSNRQPRSEQVQQAVDDSDAPGNDQNESDNLH